MPGWLFNAVPPGSSHSLSISMYTHVPVAFIAQHPDELIGQSRDSVHKACTQITMGTVTAETVVDTGGVARFLDVRDEQ